MNQEKDLLYQKYIKREEDSIRAPYNPEIEFYSAIGEGDVQKVRESLKEPFHKKKGLGKLSDNPLQNMKYHFAITAALVARYCISAGMHVSEAYDLSDIYIQSADRCKAIAQISEVHRQMCLDYAQSMQKYHKNNVTSLHIIKCIDYIYDNLNTRITVDSLASLCGLSSSYLSRLFQQQTGHSITDYIQSCKIETAQNMLIYSDYPPAQIAAILAFPSQSYFNEVFRKRTGTTPLKYRSDHFRETRG